MAVGGGTGLNALIKAIFTAEGEESVIAALRDQIEATNRLRGAQKQQGDSAVRQQRRQRREIKQTSKAGTDLGRSFRNILLRTVAIIGVLRTFSLIREGISKLIKTGTEYNETIESATLSVAALITATSDLVTTNGEVLEGVAALDVAYALAEDQIQKLRVAGIQTAATTQDLVNAYQQAVGAGLAAGLTLDQIRVITIRLTQAAGALQLPYRQLNEEVRSILGGIIDQNTRIAKSLGITNDQIRAAKEQGRLYEFLNEQFESFGIAGERILRTFSAIRSNVQETVELLAGQATKPLFDALRVEGLEQIQRLFNFDTAAVADQFQGLVDAMQLLFRQIGDLATDTIESFIDGLERLSENADELEEKFFSIGTSIGRIVESVFAWWGNFFDLLDISGGLAQVLETIADIMENAANHAKTFALTLGLAGFGVAALLTSIFGPAGAAVVALGAAIGLALARYDELTNSVEELYRASQLQLAQDARNQQEFVRRTLRIDRLVDTYAELIKQLDNATEGSKEYERIMRDVVEIEQELSDLGLAALIRAANDERKVTLELLKDELKLRRQALGLRIIALENQLREFQDRQSRLRAEALEEAGVDTAFDGSAYERQLELARQGIEINEAGEIARREALARGAQVVGDLTDLTERQRKILQEGLGTPEFIALTEIIDDLGEEIGLSKEQLDQLNAALGVTSTSLRGVGGDTEDAKTALEKYKDELILIQAIIKARLSRDEAALKSQFGRREISIAQYYDGLAEIRDRDLDAQLEIQNELLRLAEDEEDRQKAVAKTVEVTSARRVQRLEEEAAKLKALEKLEKDRTNATIEYYEATGRAAEAATLKIEEEYRELIERLRAEGDLETISIIEQLIDIEESQARFAELEQIVKDAQGRLQERIQEIGLLEQLGAISELAGRELSAEAYREVEAAIVGMEAELRGFIETSQDPELVRNAEALLALLQETRLNILLLTDEWARFRREVRDAATDSLADYLADAVLEADNLEQALSNLLNIRTLIANIAAEVVRLTARMIALRIVTAAFGSAGVPLPAGGEVATSGIRTVSPFATGGEVHGPGGPTSDRVPALLSAGEYVIRASSVKKYGSDFFSKLNAGIIDRPIRRYRDGGMVAGTGTTVAPSGGGAELRGSLELGLQDGLVVQEMDTPAGERLMLKVISRNPRRVRAALGI